MTPCIYSTNSSSPPDYAHVVTTANHHTANRLILSTSFETETINGWNYTVHTPKTRWRIPWPYHFQNNKAQIQSTIPQNRVNTIQSRNPFCSSKTTPHTLPMQLSWCPLPISSNLNCICVYMLLKPKNSTWAIVTFYNAADSVLDNVYAISKVYYVITTTTSTLPPLAITTHKQKETIYSCQVRARQPTKNNTPTQSPQKEQKE